ncbi:MAG: hypothetical protein AMXMBFR58_27150 [Phycisphaerae bacterium]
MSAVCQCRLAFALWTLCAALAAALPGCASTTRTTTAAQQPAPTDSERRGDGYYLASCAACGGLLGTTGPAVTVLYQGREVIVCDQRCRAAFEAALPDAMARLDQVMIADQKPLYPTSFSIVSNRSLPDDATEFIWMNRLIRVCDADEQSTFLANPEVFIQKLDRAVIDYRLPRYDIDKCLVQGVELDEDSAVNVVVANRLLRVCCGDCAARVRNMPRSRIPNVDFAWARVMRDEPH